jgi:hypothetical protein
MAHILTDAETVDTLRIASVGDIANKDMLLSAVDDGIKTETGHDWAADTTIDPTAKLTASILLVSLYYGTDLPVFYTYKIGQLYAKALEMATT